MSVDVTLVDAQRKCWERSRQAMGVGNPADDGFACGGLASMVEALSVRIVVLPADPAADVIEFDEAFWAWWKEHQTVSVGAGRIRWGQQDRPTAQAALHCEPSSHRENEPPPVNRYLALQRNGGIDVALGRSGAYVYQDRRVFLLTSIVAHVWATVGLMAEVAARWPEVSPPFEMTVAMHGTRGAVLGNVADGWREPLDFGWQPPMCWEQNVFLRLELTRLPVEEDTQQEIAERLGGRVEDAFGSRDRRFRSRVGDSAGHLDLSKFRSD